MHESRRITNGHGPTQRCASGFLGGHAGFALISGASLLRTAQRASGPGGLRPLLRIILREVLCRPDGPTVGSAGCLFSHADDRLLREAGQRAADRLALRGFTFATGLPAAGAANQYSGSLLVVADTAADRPGHSPSRLRLGAQASG